jgi:hypothetical protein
MGQQTTYYTFILLLTLRRGEKFLRSFGKQVRSKWEASGKQVRSFANWREAQLSANQLIINYLDKTEDKNIQKKKKLAEWELKYN